MESQFLSQRHQELMIGYVTHSLSEAETAEFERHLAQNPHLIAELQEFEAVMGLIAHAVPQSPAPQGLRDRVMSDIQPRLASRPITSARRWRWEWMAVSVAALFIGGLGLRNHLLLQELVAHQDEQTTFAFTLSTAEAIAPTGEIVLDLELGRALFAIQNLPPLKSGETYTLWAFTEEAPILCGSFAPNGAGQAVTQIAIPIDEYGSPIVSMQVFKGKADNPSNLEQSVPIMTSQI